MTTTAQSAPPIEPGISLTLAQWRVQHYRDIRYSLRIQLVEGSAVLKGNLEIRAKLPPKPVDVVLDWRGAPVRDVRVNGVTATPEVGNEHLVISKKLLKGGNNTVQLAFESPVAVTGSAVTRYQDREDGSEYLYSLLVPADAKAHAGEVLRLNREATAYFERYFARKFPFATAKATEALLPEFDAWTAFHALKLGAVRADATRGTTAIRYPLANLADAKSAYGAIVYAKGPAVLRQAEFFLGEPVFRRAVRDFVRRHAFSAAGWQDLVRAFERASGRKLGRWAAAWVERRGMPTVRVAGGRLEQQDALGEGGLWPMKLRVLTQGHSEDVFLEKRILKIKTPAHPSLVLPNAGDFGYGRFLLDAQSIDIALATSFEPGSTLLQAQLVEALWESVRDAELPPGRFLGFAISELPKTRDDIAVSGLLALIEAAFRRYLNNAQRDALAPALERAVRIRGRFSARFDGS